GTVGVIVQTVGRSGATVESAVHRLGGRVTDQLPIVNGFAARLPARAVQGLAHVAGVRAVTLDGTMRVQASTTPAQVGSGDNLPSVYRRVVGADRLAGAGDNGHGVTVALIDTGVSSLPDIAGRLVP